MASKADILARLQKDILALQGFRSPSLEQVDTLGLGRMNDAFPNGVFPLAAVHEFFSFSAEETTSAAAFIAGMLSSLLRNNNTALWISANRLLFPPALHAFGVQPSQVIFLDLKKEKEVSWAIDEALKCRAISAVVGELSELSFTASRRFQLAIEQSGVPCFVLRKNPKNLATTAVTRWQLKPLPGRAEEGLPGVGHPRWLVNLLRVRNGKPGSWDIEWVNGRFCQVPKLALLPPVQKKKTG